ncbi:MAG: amidohydrolase family protein [Lachnospiraceae bacterium]
MIWQQRKSMVLKNATLHIGNGEVLQGDMKIEDGKITEIGKSLSGGEVQDMTGKDIFPGFIDSGNFLGTQDMAYFAKDYNENSSPVTPYLDIWHSLDPDELSLQEFYKAGITSTVVTPGNEGLLGGTCAVVKTVGKNINKITVRRDVALKASFTSEVIRVFQNKGGPKTPMAMADALKTALSQTEYTSDYRGQRTKEVMDAVRSGRMPVLAACENVSEIERFFDVTKSYPDMKIILTLSYEADRAEKSIKERNAAVVLGDTSRSSLQMAHKTNFAKLVDMAESGTKFGLTVLGTDMAWGKEMLLWTASKLMQTCKSSETIVSMLTANPAELFGVSDRIGLLKAGLDADYVVYEGDPVKKCGARLLETVINGETVYQA